MLKKFRELKKYVYEEKTKLNATREKWTIVHRNSQEDCWQISYQKLWILESNSQGFQSAKKSFQ